MYLFHFAKVWHSRQELVIQSNGEILIQQFIIIWVVWSNAHAYAGMTGMYNVTGVLGMLGLWNTAADSCHLLWPSLPRLWPLCLSFTHTVSHTHWHPWALLYLAFQCCFNFSHIICLFHWHTCISGSAHPYTPIRLTNIPHPVCKQTFLLISGDFFKPPLSTL